MLRKKITYIYNYIYNDEKEYKVKFLGYDNWYNRWLVKKQLNWEELIKEFEKEQN